MLNKVQIIGYIGKDAEKGAMGSGRSFCNFSVATTKQWKDKQTGEKKEKTTWHRCSIFGNRADAIAQYLTKGRLVYVEGEINQREWKGEDGSTRYAFEILASDIQFLGKPKDGYSGPSIPPPGDQDIPY